MQIFEGTSSTVPSIVADFQVALGDPNNGNDTGPIADGRREINWDAGIVPFDIPPDFFNITVPRGAEFRTDAGSEFRVSNPEPTDPGAPDFEFDSINASYPDQFTTFSAPRLFTPIDTTVFEVNFFVSRTNIPATTNGFGAIFTDVDLGDSTKIDYYDIDNNLLLSEYVDPDPQGLSFLGATFADHNLFRVEVTTGNTPLGPDDDPATGIDVVVVDDFLYGEPQVANPITGDQGADVLTGTPDDDFLDGQGGNDAILAFGGNDIALGGDGNDVISGGDGIDQLLGGNGDDTIVGDRGDDTKLGGDGNDRIIWNDGDGSDLIDGGADFDTVEVNGNPDAGDIFQVDGASQVLFERVNLGLFDLDITTVESLEVNGGGGDDQLTVGELSFSDLQAVNFDGGDGNDRLDGSATIAALSAIGGSGNDTFTGGSAADTLSGGGDNDVLSGNGGDDLLFGDAGDDTLQGGGGNDFTDGGLGNDTADFSDIPFEITADLNLGEATYEVSGVTVTDTLVSIENLIGSTLDDVLGGDRQANRLEGREGNDQLIGRRGNDTLLGAAGDDVLLGGLGADFLNGGADDDLLRGGRGADTLIGGLGNDILLGNGGADDITGNSGNDVILGGGGADIFRFGSDLLTDGQADVDIIQGFQGQDTLDFTAYVSAGGIVDINRIAAGFLQVDLNGEDIVNIFGGQGALNVAESQLSAFADV